MRLITFGKADFIPALDKTASRDSKRHKRHEQTDWRNGVVLYAKETKGLTSLRDSIQIRIYIVVRLLEYDTVKAECYSFHCSLLALSNRMEELGKGESSSCVQ